MTLRQTLAALAVFTLAGSSGCATSDEHSTTSRPGIGGTEAPSHSTPLKESGWYTQNFGTPLLAANTRLQPRAVEQAHDPGGIALPQTGSTVDGPVMWQRVLCEALPFTTSDGPTRRRAQVIYGGFARTPLGAALAAYHLRNFGGTATVPEAITTIVAPGDRARVVPQLRLADTEIPVRASDCLATSRKNGIRRPARWHAEQISTDVLNIGFWFAPETSSSARGYSIDVTVTWVEGDWFLSEQSIGEIGYSGQQKQPVPGEEPLGWLRW